MSLRERKKRLAQTAIEETALRLFRERGYEQTSIRDITEDVVMSPRTFFRYFASKEEILFAPTQSVLEDGVNYLQRVSATESTRSALAATFVYLAGLYQQQRERFLTCYHVAIVTPPLASMYLYSLVATEPAICQVLSARLGMDADQKPLRLLVAIYMAAFRVTLEGWLENEADGDLVSLLREHLERLTSLSQID